VTLKWRKRRHCIFNSWGPEQYIEMKVWRRRVSKFLFLFVVCNVKCIFQKSFCVGIVGVELGVFQSQILEVGRQAQDN